MKSNNIKYQVKQLTYFNEKLIDTYLFPAPFDNLEEVDKFICFCKNLDSLDPEYIYCYIIMASFDFCSIIDNPTREVQGVSPDTESGL